MLALGNWVKAVQELSIIFTFLEVLTLPQNEKLWGEHRSHGYSLC